MAYSGGQEEKMSVLTLRPESMLMSQGQGLQATYPDTSETSKFLPTPYRTNLHRQEYMRWLKVFTAITWHYSGCDSSDPALTPGEATSPRTPHSCSRHGPHPVALRLSKVAPRLCGTPLTPQPGPQEQIMIFKMELQ